jgi:hypothetical protein
VSQESLWLRYGESLGIQIENRSTIVSGYQGAVEDSRTICGCACFSDLYNVRIGNNAIVDCIEELEVFNKFGYQSKRPPYLLYIYMPKILAINIMFSMQNEIHFGVWLLK